MLIVEQTGPGASVSGQMFKSCWLKTLSRTRKKRKQLTRLWVVKSWSWISSHCGPAQKFSSHSSSTSQTTMVQTYTRNSSVAFFEVNFSISGRKKTPNGSYVVMEGPEVARYVLWTSTLLLGQSEPQMSLGRLFYANTENCIRQLSPDLLSGIFESSTRTASMLSSPFSSNH